MKTGNRFIKGYSGLRALAVLGVILYHLDPNTYIGGYLGVPIFLVLSGYLVTDHILASYDELGFYDNQRFYLGRLKKLYPQLITVLAGSGAYMLLFQQNLLAKFNQIVIANLLNFYNFWQISNGQSYFERFAGNESPFTHLWTMSIEGQFYIVWPLLMYFLVKLFRRRKGIFWFFTVLTLLSALEMALLYQPGVDTSRIYYGTDTRFFSLGIGAMLACCWPIKHLKVDISKHDGHLLDAVGALAFLGMIFLFFTKWMDPQTSFPYRGGMLFFSVFTAILVAIIAHPGSHWNQIFTNRVFDWIGSRSYGIYLYQFPVMIFFENKFTDMANHAALYHLIEVIIILLIAELTYRLVERPFAKINLEKVYDFKEKLMKENSFALKIISAVMTLILILSVIAFIKSPQIKAPDPNKSQLAQTIKKNRQKQVRDNKKLAAEFKKGKTSESTAKAEAEAKKAAKTKPVNREFEKYDISQVDLQLAQKVRVTAVGDSVMAGASDALKQLMPHALIDAAVSRQMVPTIGIFQNYTNQGALADNVLVGLGTNGPFSMGDVDRLMSIIGKKRHVFWISVKVPRPWQNQVNDLLKQAADKYSNLTIINWYDYSKDHDSWFYKDQTHPTLSGAKYYSAYVTKQIVKNSKF
ncbi:acyltransferase family protein [Lactobacillus psittaci]|uniref:Acyltransferase n=1 Tax=Lactobacillus psittaci DSM 15354 TaxID=1122152 RepID=A0A0R1SEE4_9LACO|nr:acyltransferase family protein [Lactobacillus psittaci]KRL63547.1 acyltransferase [Lactobacillus psittaci DSM 15354]